MKSPERSFGLPLDYAAELVMEIHLMRGECSEAARDLMENAPLDETALEECAVLDDALDRAYAILKAAISGIKLQRSGEDVACE
jgi:hypothetical protein